MKIFGLGFHKTGSTTLESALIILGYDSVGKHNHLFSAINENDWDKIDDAIQKHDAFRDMPWPLFYEKLHERYPESKFILTVRDAEKWIESCKNHYKDNGDLHFAKIYGEGLHFPIENEAHWIEVYERHNKSVKDFFIDKPESFLELNWERGDDWQKLCDFLDKPIPLRAFPHANKGRYTLIGKIARKIEWLFDREGFRKRNRDL